MNYTDKIIEIIRNEMDMFIEPDAVITPDMNLAADLHIDSLDMVLVVDAIEEEFGINIKNEDMSGIRTVRDIEKKIIEMKQGSADRGIQE